ncbi:MAG: hypothetical protein KBC66_07810 [Kiritimatiellae bacterium]|nr:hypothetical protein [Kiritimatiellia bacterium]NLD89370.1 hypothetical protein [Lentisphaerota bacterium]HOU21702.1 lipopolysaccharide kinase InaA family protein [Kiritimatiellia bacterium]HQQ60011.1 lipopolysaccharide kinase InaA family protein [Kiritimatiellia bacterium]
MPASGSNRLPPPRRVLIAEDQPEAHAVRQFIASDQWRSPGSFEPLITRNPRYRLYEFSLVGTQTRCILKIARAAPETYRPARLLGVWFSHLTRDPARRAYRGARLLARHGIPTFRPLACWRARTAGFWPDSFLLYAKINARFSLRDFLLGATGLSPEENAQSLAMLTESFADLVAHMHRQGVLHNDLACGNFLVDDHNLIHVIDADHVRYSPLRWPPGLKRFFDLNDLRRLNLHEPLQRIFLHRYLGGRHSNFWWRVFLFWHRGGNRPIRWLLRQVRLRAALAARSDE